MLAMSYARLSFVVSTFLFGLLVSFPAHALSLSRLDSGYFKVHAITTEHFQIEYSELVGTQPDSDRDGVPNLVESIAEMAEDSWDVIVDEMGYENPIESDIGRLLLLLDDTNEYLIPGALGITGLLTNEDPYMAIDPWLDEDYLRVTVSHELFHAIQFGYDSSFALNYQGINWAEATAVWAEEQVYDSIDDYVNYLEDFYEYPDYSVFASTAPDDTLFQYALNIWPIYLSERYGTGFIREIWENYFDSSLREDSVYKVFEAVNATVESKGDRLRDVFADFSIANLDPATFYEEGGLYPEVYIIDDPLMGEYARVQDDLAPALFGTNYLNFENTDREDSFHFHLVTPDDLGYMLTLIPYNDGDYNYGIGKQVYIPQGSDLEQEIIIDSLRFYDGVMAIVSPVDEDLGLGANDSVFDYGFLYYFLAQYGESVQPLVDAQQGASVDLDATGEKEGEAIGEQVRTIDALQLSIVDYDEDSVSLSWNRISDSAIVGYRLEYGYESGSYGFINEIDQAYRTFALVRGLDDNDVYYFRVVAVDERGQQVAEASAEIAVRPAEWIFTDVSYVHPHYDAIAELVDAGLFEGYEDGSFRPADAINRAELLKILIEGRGLNADASLYANCFNDVQGQWYAKYVCYAKEQGWVQGYADGTFRASNTVSKVEALKILFEVYERDLQEGLAVPSLPYPDLSLDAWYSVYVREAAQLGILTENVGSSFNANEGRNRGDMAEILYRYLVLQG